VSKTDPDLQLRQTVLSRDPDVVTREIAGETMLVPVTGKLAQLQQVFVLEGVGAHIWSQLNGDRSLQEVLDSILDEYEVSLEVARADMLELIDELLEAGLVTAEPSPENQS
jgi:hypothetical protein